MDTSAANISFDAQGQCNYCSDFLHRLKQTGLVASQAERESFLQCVRRDGKGKDYDCIIGLSGGVDSSYALYLAVKNGLRPLVVHLDNGWNSELAVNNISNLVRLLNVDLYTHVIDWGRTGIFSYRFSRQTLLTLKCLWTMPCWP